MKSLRVTIQMKAIERFRVVLFTILYNVVLTSEFEEET